MELIRFISTIIIKVLSNNHMNRLWALQHWIKKKREQTGNLFPLYEYTP